MGACSPGSARSCPGLTKRRWANINWTLRQACAQSGLRSDQAIEADLPSSQQVRSWLRQAVFYGDLNQEVLEVFLVQIEKSMFYGQLNQED